MPTRMGAGALVLVPYECGCVRANTSTVTPNLQTEAEDTVLAEPTTKHHT
jgi:hypothetical protein